MVRILKITGALAVVIMLMGEAAHAAAPTRGNESSDWSGPYIGAFAGYSAFHLKYSEPDYPGFERTPYIHGFAGGVLFGYNFQTDRLVLGAEADGGTGNNSKGRDASASNNYSAFKIDWTAHVRARIGFVSDSTLLYAAAGLALAKVTVDDMDPAWGKDDATHIGWTVGGGIEHAITTKLRVRAEYLYDDYGSKNYSIGGPLPYRAKVDLTAQTIRAALSYCF